MPKSSANQASQHDKPNGRKKAPIVQIMEFDANQFTSNWDQSASFLKELRYERLQLQKRILNKRNSSGQSVLEQGLLSEDAPEYIQTLLMQIIKTFSKEEQTQFLRTILLRNPESKVRLETFYPDFDSVLAEQFQLPEDIQNPTLKSFFQEYSNAMATQSSAEANQDWIKACYTGNQNVLLDAIHTNDFNLLKEVFNITAIISPELLLEKTESLLSNFMQNNSMTPLQKNTIKQMLLELLWMHPGDVSKLSLSNAFTEAFAKKHGHSLCHPLDAVFIMLSRSASQPSLARLYPWTGILSSLEQGLIGLDYDFKTTVLTPHFRKLLEIYPLYTTIFHV